MGNKIIYTLWFHVIYIFIYLSSMQFFRGIMGYEEFGELVIMLLPSVFSIISLLLLVNSEFNITPMVFCIIAWCMVGYCYLDLNVPFYGGKIYVGANNYAPTTDEHRKFKMILLCVCVFALLLNFVFAKQRKCEYKTYSNRSYKTKLIIAICFEVAYTLLFLWRNADHILFFLGKAVTEILFVSSILVIPPLITVLTATFIIIKKKQRVELIYVLLAAGAVSQPIAICMYVYSEKLLYYFGYSVYSILHFTGILLALSGAIEYKDCNETIN